MIFFRKQIFTVSVEWTAEILTSWRQLHLKFPIKFAIHDAMLQVGGSVSVLQVIFGSKNYEHKLKSVFTRAVYVCIYIYIYLDALSIINDLLRTVHATLSARCLQQSQTHTDLVSVLVSVAVFNIDAPEWICIVAHKCSSIQHIHTTRVLLRLLQVTVAVSADKANSSGNLAQGKNRTEKHKPKTTTINTKVL